MFPLLFRPGHSWLVYFRVPPNAGTWELALGWAGLGGRAWEPSQEVKRGVRVATPHYAIDVYTYVYRARRPSMAMSAARATGMLDLWRAGGEKFKKGEGGEGRRFSGSTGIFTQREDGEGRQEREKKKEK